ncbi:MAG TPA: thioredoxin family protein [Candidatus Saccharibacteria bacterium]|nr:thioredoxin family protein [Candidatus Saccharibacteria bacterium]
MKKIVFIVGGIVVLVGGVLAWAYLSSSQEATRQNQQAARTDQTTDSTKAAAKDQAELRETKGAYVVYEGGTIASTKGTKVLFFHAPWCPQCRALHEDIKNSAIPNGVTIVKVDYDSHQDLREKYGVTLQTTFVLIDDNGDLVKKYVAYNEPTFDSVKRNLLEDNS